MKHSILIVAVCAGVTMLTRFLPFLIFGRGRQLPDWLSRLGKVLPFAIMGMLVVYCLKDAAWSTAPFAIPELLGCAAVVLLHIWKRNTLLSIGGGTAIYMILINFIF